METMKAERLAQYPAMKFSSWLSSLQLQAMCALMAILVAITVSCSVVVHCSKVDEEDSNAPIHGTRLTNYSNAF